MLSWSWCGRARTIEAGKPLQPKSSRKQLYEPADTDAAHQLHADCLPNGAASWPRIGANPVHQPFRGARHGAPLAILIAALLFMQRLNFQGAEVGLGAMSLPSVIATNAIVTILSAILLLIVGSEP